MFSQWRNVVENVVENLAQPTPQRASSQSPERRPERPEHRTRNSFDTHGSPTRGQGNSAGSQSTGSLAEAAFTNLRKSLAANRAPFSIVSPGGGESSSGRSSPAPGPQSRELKPIASHKTTLEERLRASFAIGEASTSTTPENLSHAPSPKPQTEISPPEQILSPSSTPLPESPITGPSSVSHTIIPETSATTESDNGTSSSNDEPLDEAANGEAEVHPGLNIPLPASPEPEHPANTESIMKILDSQPSEHTSVSDEVDAVTSDILEKREETSQSLNPLIENGDAQSSNLSVEVEEYRIAENNANELLIELTPAKSIRDLETLREYLMQIATQTKAYADEIKTLSARQRTYDSRIEELRDTHRLESRSQTQLVDSLRKQLEETDALLKSEQAVATQAKEDAQKARSELEQVRSESQKLTITVKEEEEKRVKAISLLKTVRQKLVKAEKEKDETAKELADMKEKEKAVKDEVQAEKAKLQKELESVRESKQKDVLGLKQHFDRELVGMREKLEKEFAARKGQFELEAALVKTTLQKEISQKSSRITTLENSVRSLTAERDSLFDQLQLRQAELESSQSHLETQQSNTSELQFQLREAEERAALATEELADVRRELEYLSLQPPTSKDQSMERVASVEATYEARLNELRTRMSDIERERNETEIALNRSLAAKTQEIDSMRAALESSTANKDKTEEELTQMRRTIEELKHQAAVSQAQLADVQNTEQRVRDLEAVLQKQFDDFSAKTEDFDRQIAESKEREATLKASNKTLREELRKVQNSAALLERQRNPGVGYWSSSLRQRNGSEAQLPSSTSSSMDLNSPSRTMSPPPATPPTSKNDEEVNLEYLRNLILQFLEHKERRSQLVKVLSIILQFTPQETRRLVAKV
ncbi:hypothetical protein SCHPADRAFT_34879 [Schizopora paradoxa]|uniref:GRIP domain-containing protein n=1 Tax=Schizopora paradoxa TaxID=27342 RepID=A0A0H2SEP8_9AGAM|nr:hypothetical protein SCHPADRAFT_34879 [Schizopora paradoxa]